jgi:integrase/recombinase XerD
MRRRIPAADSWELHLTRYLKRLEATGHSPRTIRSRRDMGRLFAAYAKEAGIRGPEGLSPSVLSAYLVHRRETLNSRGRKDRPRTLNTHLLAVRRWLGFLAKEGVVAPSLASAVEYVRAPETLPRDVPTDAEVSRMIRACDTLRSTGFRDRAILELLYSTGIRRQELCDLEVGDVDLAQGYLRVERGKGGKGRVLPLGRLAGEWIRRYLLAVRPELVRGRPDPGRLFLTKSGRKMDGAEVLQAVLKAARRAGLEKRVTPHALRRACATEMIRRNANPWHVKELLGHEDFRSLDVYAKLTILDLKEAHRRFHPREQGEDPGTPLADLERP